MAERVHNRRATIAAGASASGAVDMYAFEPVGVHVNAWTAATMAFEISLDGEYYAPLFDSAGAEYTISVGALRRITFSSALAAALKAGRFVKFRSGTSAIPVNQVAQVTVELTLRIGSN
ncbi:MAG: hypothetical protein ACRDGM_04290 [bacterium]